MGSALMGIDLDQAKSIISQVRNVAFSMRGCHPFGEQRGVQGPWIEELSREFSECEKTPIGYECHTWRRGAVVHALAWFREGIAPMCYWKTRWEAKNKSMTVEDISQAAYQFGGKFCEDCEPLLKASLRHQVSQLWARY